MNPIRLFAVDGNDAVIREDGFLLETDPEKGVLRRLTVASVLPSNTFEVDGENLYLNLIRFKGERTPLFAGSRVRPEDASLHSKVEKPVLATVFEMRDDGTFEEQIRITEATISPLTYDQFQKSPGFAETQKKMENFILQDPHTWYTYTQPAPRTWDNTSAANRLVSAMMSLFNKTCTFYAHAKRIETIRARKTEVTFRVHRNAVVFNAPLRKAEGLINLRNLTAHIKGERMAYSLESLRAMGVKIG